MSKFAFRGCARVVAVISGVLAVSGCSYYVDQPTTSPSVIAGGSVDCSELVGAFGKDDYEKAVKYLTCAKQKLIERRDKLELYRKSDNIVTGAGLVGVAAAGLFNAGRNAIVGGGLVSGTSYTLGQVVDGQKFESFYSAGVQQIDCLAARSAALKEKAATVLKRVAPIEAKLTETPNSCRAGAVAYSREMMTSLQESLPENMRIQADSIIDTVNENIRQTLPTPDGVKAAFSNMKGSLTNLPASSSEVMDRLMAAEKDTPAAGGAAAAMADILNLDSNPTVAAVCGQSTGFTVSRTRVVLKPGKTESFSTSALAFGGWAGGKEDIVVDPATSSATEPRSGFSLKLPDGSKTEGNFVYRVQPVDQKLGAAIDVNIVVRASGSSECNNK